MKRLMIALLLTAGAAEAKKADKGHVLGTGFTCTAQDGAVKRLNIDLERSRYQDDERAAALGSVSETKITIESPNPSLMSTPMGPVIHTLELDRRTLVLTDALAMPDRNVHRRTDYQCVPGAPIDFTAGRQF